MSTVIRPATLTDGSFIYDFLCILEDTQLDRSAFDSVFGRNLTDPAIRYRVADQNGSVVGFLSCHSQYLLHHTGQVGEIQELYVRPECRSQGIGRQLLTTLMADLHSINLTSLEVTTNRHRADAIRFYESMSFRPTHIKLVRHL